MDSFNTAVRFARYVILLLAGITLLALHEPTANAPIVIKLATLAPTGSPWYDLLDNIRQEWFDISRGQVILRIYSGGGFGDEGDIIVKMRLNQIQAAAVTTKGLGQIYQGVWALSLPTVFESSEQLNRVRHQLHDDFVERLESGGVKLLFWAGLGWTYWFGRYPIRTPDDLRQQRIFNWEAIDLQSVYKVGGFHAVKLSSIDILPGLHTGLIDCFTTTPLMAATFQWFSGAKNMTKFNWGSLVGGLVVSTDAWNDIPATLQPRLIEAAEAEALRFEDKIRQLDEEAIQVMTQYGLTVVEITPEEEAEWRATIKPYLKLLRGTIVDTTMYDKVINLVEEMPAEIGAE